VGGNLAPQFFRYRGARVRILALRWSAILWGEGHIRISKRWAKGEDGETKTEASDGYVRMQLLPNTGVRDAFCSSEADPLFGFKLAANEIQ
jgi:hypothetical protein